MVRIAGLVLLACLVSGCGDDSPGDGGADAGHVGHEGNHEPGGSTPGSALALPDDPSETGPWPVGARTVTVEGLTVEVWYPAEPDSETGKEKFIYDLAQYLPDGQTLTEDFELPCDCYAELPIASEHGPFPVVVFIHGFSGLRIQSLNHMVHWASRGFVVVSADHPSIYLTRLAEEGLTGLLADGGSIIDPVANCDPSVNKQSADAVTILDALQEPVGEAEFLTGDIDMTRVGAAGHSAGARAIQPLGTYPGVRVVIPMSMYGVCPDSPHLESTLVMGGEMDGITPFAQQQQGYDEAPTKKRLVGLARAGHMAFTDFCPFGAGGEGGILEAAVAAGFMIDQQTRDLIGSLASDGCGEAADGMPYQSPEAGWKVTNYATSAALEETLLGMDDRAQALADIETVLGAEVGTYQEALE